MNNTFTPTARQARAGITAEMLQQQAEYAIRETEFIANQEATAMKAARDYLSACAAERAAVFGSSEFTAANAAKNAAAKSADSVLFARALDMLK